MAGVIISREKPAAMMVSSEALQDLLSPGHADHGEPGFFPLTFYKSRMRSELLDNFCSFGRKQNHENQGLSSCNDLPREVSWPEGFKLAAQMGYRFPQLGSINLGAQFWPKKWKNQSFLRQLVRL